MRLKKPCEHGDYDAHQLTADLTVPLCPGGEFATLDDLIAALNAMGIEGKIRVSYIGPPERLYVDD